MLVTRTNKGKGQDIDFLNKMHFQHFDALKIPLVSAIGQNIETVKAGLIRIDYVKLGQVYKSHTDQRDKIDILNFLSSHFDENISTLCSKL